MIEQAENAARDPRARHKLEALHASTHQWAGHVHHMISAAKEANLPWSQTAERLIDAARTGQDLQAQVRSIHMHAVCMCDPHVINHVTIDHMTVMCGFIMHMTITCPYHMLCTCIRMCMQLKHVSTQTDRMMDVASTAIEAVETEEATGSGSSLDEHVQV